MTLCCFVHLVRFGFLQISLQITIRRPTNALAGLRVAPRSWPLPEGCSGLDSGLTVARLEATSVDARCPALLNRPEDFRSQIQTTFFGPVNVTRAAVQQMRQQRSGLVMTISSTAGIAAEGDFRVRLCRLEVRRRGLDGGLRSRGRAVRHQDDAGGARLLPYRTAHPAVHQVRQRHPSRTTPTASTPPSKPGRAWTASRPATRPNWPAL
jgi:NAD(P)-dependent dehydrogenase (short-subunit alcohol dehydrogenase family)